MRRYPLRVLCPDGLVHARDSRLGVLSCEKVAGYFLPWTEVDLKKTRAQVTCLGCIAWGAS